MTDHSTFKLKNNNRKPFVPKTRLQERQYYTHVLPLLKAKIYIYLTDQRKLCKHQRCEGSLHIFQYHAFEVSITNIDFNLGIRLLILMKRLQLTI